MAELGREQTLSRVPAGTRGSAPGAKRPGIESGCPSLGNGRPIRITYSLEMPTRIEKLESHASHLLDAFIQLRERYAMLEPLLFDEHVILTRGIGRQARGFIILKNSLFLSCAQDIAKLTLDRDERVPSIGNLWAALSEELPIVRSRFVDWKIPSIEEEGDPEIQEALRRIEQREQDDRSLQFEDLYTEGAKLWTDLSSSAVLTAFKTVRDKVYAHVEVRYVADKYQLVDIGKLGIVWGDLRITVDRMQRLVEILGLLIRNAGFAWDMLDTQLDEASQAFWTSGSGPGPGTEYVG